MEILKARRSSFISAAIVIGFSVLTSGCEDAVPPLGPIDVKPSIALADVPEHLDLVAETDGARVVALAHEAVGDRIGADARDSILAPVEPGKYHYTWVHVNKAQKWVFVIHTASGYEVATIKPSDQGHIVVPIDWMKRTITFALADEAAEHTWDAEMSRRVAERGSASGIAVMANGSATGIVVDLRRDDDSKDVVLVARTQHLKAGTYDAAAWGPRIDGMMSVVAIKTNHHDGVSLYDMMRSPAPTNAPGTPPPRPSPVEALPPGIEPAVTVP